MNQLDLTIIAWLKQMMHTYIPFTNIYAFGFPLGEYTLYCVMLYIAGEIYLIKTGNLHKKGAKR
jgi:hypothetical protein